MKMRSQYLDHVRFVQSKLTGCPGNHYAITDKTFRLQSAIQIIVSRSDIDFPLA